MRIEPAQVEIVGHVAPGLGEDPLEHPRHGQDRRPHVEPVAAILMQRRLAAEPVVALHERDLVAARGQGACRRQAAEARADDADSAHSAASFTVSSGMIPRPGRPRSCAARVDAILADSKMVGKPDPGCVPPPVR